MKNIAFFILIIFAVSCLELPNGLAQPPWSDISIPTPKPRKKEKSKIPGKEEEAKKVRIHKDHKTRRAEYKQFYSAFISNNGTIDKEERVFLDLKKAELELSDDEVEDIEFLVKLESPMVLRKD
jgi:hypothetical protein